MLVVSSRRVSIVLHTDLKFIASNLAFTVASWLATLHYGLGNNLTVKDNEIIYHLVTRQHPQGILLNYTNLELVDPCKPTKVIIAGWLYGINETLYTSINREYLGYEDCNVINVDWTKYSFNAILASASTVFPVGGYKNNCISSSIRVVVLGQALGRFLVKLNNQTHLPYSNIHLIGHSFGAHIASAAANHVQQVAKEKVYRVTGLDVGILMELKTVRFNEDAAEVVDAVHTGSPVASSVLPQAMVDFYVNGGTVIQPGCSWLPNKLFKDFYEFTHFGEFLFLVCVCYRETRFQNNIKFCFYFIIALCSHFKSFLYFADSINNSSIYGTKCDSWENFKKGLCDKNDKAVFGEHYQPGPTGKFYFYFNSSSSHSL